MAGLCGTFDSAFTLEEGGLAGQSFPKVINARQIALGDCYAAVHHSFSLSGGNPSAFDHTIQSVSGLSYSALTWDRFNQFLGTSFKVSQTVMGFGLHHWGTQDIEGRGDQAEDITGFFSDQNYNLNFGFARAFKNSFYLGLKGSLIYRDIQNFSAWGSGIGLGTFFEPKDWIMTGLILNDIFSIEDWNVEQTVKTYLPNMRWGIGLAPTEFLLWTLDIEKYFPQEGASIQNYFTIHSGLEIGISRYFKIRLGWDDGQWSGGTGFLFPLINRFVQFDYGIKMGKGDLSAGHYFTLQFFKGDLPAIQTKTSEVDRDLSVDEEVKFEWILGCELEKNKNIEEAIVHWERVIELCKSKKDPLYKMARKKIKEYGK